MADFWGQSGQQHEEVISGLKTQQEQHFLPDIYLSELRLSATASGVLWETQHWLGQWQLGVPFQGMSSKTKVPMQGCLRLVHVTEHLFYMTLRSFPAPEQGHISVRAVCKWTFSLAYGEIKWVGSLKWLLLRKYLTEVTGHTLKWLVCLKSVGEMKHFRVKTQKHFSITGFT